jgi:hypothetical protein
MWENLQISIQQQDASGKEIFHNEEDRENSRGLLRAEVGFKYMDLRPMDQMQPLEVWCKRT